MTYTKLTKTKCIFIKIENWNNKLYRQINWLLEQFHGTLPLGAHKNTNIVAEFISQSFVHHIKLDSILQNISIFMNKCFRMTPHTVIIHSLKSRSMSLEYKNTFSALKRGQRLSTATPLDLPSPYSKIWWPYRTLRLEHTKSFAFNFKLYVWTLFLDFPFRHFY